MAASSARRRRKRSADTADAPAGPSADALVDVTDTALAAPPIGGGRLIVRNLPAHVDEAALREHFSAAGRVTDACLVLRGGAKNQELSAVSLVGVV